MGELRSKEWPTGALLTASGRFVDPLRPDVEQMVLEDMAHALGHLCRFGGHCKRFYSVAEHLVRGVAHVPEEHKLAWLLHDAPEAYMVDVPAPLKRDPIMRDYCRAEDWLLSNLHRKFGVDGMWSPIVTRVDLRMLATEMRDLMRVPDGFDVRDIAEPFDGRIYDVSLPCDMQWGSSWLMRVNEAMRVREWRKAKAVPLSCWLEE